MKIPHLLYDNWNDLQRRRDDLVRLQDRLHRAKADTAAEFERAYLSNKVFAASDDVHKRRVLRDLEAGTLKQRQTAIGVALFTLEVALPAFERDVATSKTAAMR